MIHTSPSRTARVLHVAMSDPPSGSVAHGEPDLAPVDVGQHLVEQFRRAEPAYGLQDHQSSAPRLERNLRAVALQVPDAALHGGQPAVLGALRLPLEPSLCAHRQMQLFDEPIAGFVFAIQQFLGHLPRQELPHSVTELLIVGSQLYHGEIHCLTAQSSRTAKALRSAWVPDHPAPRDQDPPVPLAAA
jgi:hypothetical protein